MGHVRLGDLPRTRKWGEVVDLIGIGAGAKQVASATLLAAQNGLARAVDDAGVIETIWLLTQLPVAARGADFKDELRQRGVRVSHSPGLTEIISAVTEAIDAKMPNNRGRTDLGEMAQVAASETLMKIVGARTRGLFGANSADVRDELGKLGTVKQFGLLAKAFFARFIHKCLDYFLCREMVNHVGDGKRFSTLADQGRFTEAINLHCQQASRIVETYSGEWFSKHNWETDKNISRDDIVDFTGYAMTKLTTELRIGAGIDG